MPRMRYLALLALLSLASCKKDEPPPPPPAPAPAEEPKKAGKSSTIRKDFNSFPGNHPTAPPSAEVEARGKVTGMLPGGTTRFFLAAAPCAEPQDKVIGTAEVAPSGTFFVEVFVPQGTKAYLCAVEYDAAGQVLALAQDPRGAVTLEGQGEVNVSANLTLAAAPDGGPVSPAVRDARK